MQNGTHGNTEIRIVSQPSRGKRVIQVKVNSSLLTFGGKLYRDEHYPKRLAEKWYDITVPVKKMENYTR